MKKFLALTAILMSLLFCVPSFGEIFEASGKGKIPPQANNKAHGMVLARRGAILDLQRNLLLKSTGSNSGIIKGIVITNEKWDGNFYIVTGYIKR